MNLLCEEQVMTEVWRVYVINVIRYVKRRFEVPINDK